MNKELKINLLTAIVYLGFHDTFDCMTPCDDEKLNDMVHAYRKAYRELAAYVGFPDDLELLEKESIM